MVEKKSPHKLLKISEVCAKTTLSRAVVNGLRRSGDFLALFRLQPSASRSSRQKSTHGLQSASSAIVSRLATGRHHNDCPHRQHR